MFLDALDGLFLLGGTGNRGAVGVTGMRPSGLEVVGAEAGADLLEILELGRDEFTRLLGGSLRVEEGVDVGAEDVDDVAEGAALFFDDVHGLRGGDVAGEAGGLEGRFGRADEAGEIGHAAVVVEDGFVADDDHFDDRPVARGPIDDLGDLGLRGGDAAAGDVHAEDELEVVLFGGRADVLESVTVGRVDPDGGESFTRDDGNVREDSRRVFALAG